MTCFPEPTQNYHLAVLLSLMLGVVLATIGGAHAAVTATPAEMQQRNQWIQQRLLNVHPPFSFVFDGQPSANLLAKWPKKVDVKKLDDRRTERTLTWTDPKNGLEVRCKSVEYADFPVVEWTVYFRNTGGQKTPILENALAIDSRIERATGGEFLLRGNKLDVNNPTSYEPFQKTLGPKTREPLGANSEMPYYNFSMPGGGLILAAGWWGSLGGAFVRDAGNGLQITAGQAPLRLYLEPGEEIRTPLVALLFWKGSDALRSQNLWRRWLLAHNVPKVDGKPIQPELKNCNGNFFPNIINNAAGELEFLQAFSRAGVKIDNWWQDAAWYPCGNDYRNIGTWEPDPKRWPKGIREVTDWCHAHGIKTTVWFSPERIVPDTWLAKNHPEWGLVAKNIPAHTLFNFGDPDAWRWLIDHVDKLMTEQGIDNYRQDHILDACPAAFWSVNDAKDRQGITENKNVVGFMAFWDELRRRHPKMSIDSNNRSDLETLRRAVPLLRSDCSYDAVGQQNHTYGIASWVPYYGTGSETWDVYLMRSLMCPGFVFSANVRNKALDYNPICKLIGQWREVAPCFLGDYYPLTSYSPANDVWMAWQFDRSEQGDGVIQVFRRAESPYETARIKLYGLDPTARYELRDFDEPMPKQAAGKELLEQGLVVGIPKKPSAVVIKYRKL